LDYQKYNDLRGVSEWALTKLFGTFLEYRQTFWVSIPRSSGMSHIGFCPNPVALKRTRKDFQTILILFHLVLFQKITLLSQK
jgi:hypothetical protein